MSRASRNSRIFVAFRSPLAIFAALALASSGAPMAQGQAASPAKAGQSQRPVSMAAADFDEDGVADLAVGYATAKGGAIGLMRGNHDAIAPSTKAGWVAAGRHELTTPFLQPAKLIQISGTPDFLVAADANGDGHRDLVFAANGGSQLQMLAGTGKGTFATQPVSITIPGSITALAAYRPGAPVAGEALLVGYETVQGARLAIVSDGAAGMQINATYKLPGVATAFSVANLDGDKIPDAAIVAGGQLLILHGANAIKGGGQLETLPVDNVEAVTAGEFLIDRHGPLQLAVLNTNGDVLILAHEGFDPRPFTAQEKMATLSHGRGSKPVTTLASDTSGEPWTVVETNASAGIHPAGSAVPVLVRSRIGGSGGEDLVVLNAAQQQRVTISHSASAQVSAPARSRMVMTGIGSDKVVAAASVRVNADGRPGLAVLHDGKATPEFTVPSAGNTFYPNTLTDNGGTTTDSDDGTRCTQGSGETCTLRDAVVFANADAAANMSGGTSDMIMLQAGTYSLTWQGGILDSQGNAVTHLEVLGPVTFVGSTGGGGSTIDAGGNDVVFTINPGPYGYYNAGTGASYAFDTTLENITLQNGSNPDNPSVAANANDVGGGINWDADGTGNLNLDTVTIQNCTVQYGDGGGLWIENSAGSGTGTATLTGGTISNNQTAEEGGGAYIDFYYATLSATNTTFSNNTAAQSVNTSDTGGLGEGGGLFVTGQTSSTNSPQTTLTGVTFSGNSATAGGGGIYTTSGLNISGATLSSNASSGPGGGIFAGEGPGEVSTTITGSNVQGNSAGAGGGVYVGDDNPSNTVPSVVMSLSRIFGNTATSGSTGLVLDGAGAATATENWWGCNAGPSAALCDTADTTATTSPWAMLAITGNTGSVAMGDSIDVTVSINTDSNGNAIAGAFPGVANQSIAFSVGGVTANPGSTSGTFASDGTDTLTETPTSNGGGDVEATFDNQSVQFNFSVGTAPTFTSAGSATFTVGAAGSFTVTTTGTPTPSLMEIGALPTGVTFIDNGDGTATISGTPAAGSGGEYDIALTANNGIGTFASQGFSLTVNQVAAITSAAGATFVVGAASNFTVTTSGFPPAQLIEVNALPAGVTFVNNGDGTATLSGTPAAGTGGVYSLSLIAENGAGTNAMQSFTLTVDQAPVITSASNATFTAGAYGSFTVTSNAYPVASFSLGGPPLPNGVTLTDNGNGTATLAGIPPASTTTSVFQFAINATNGVGVIAQQNFTLTVNPPPSFVVTSTNDSGAGSLRAALASAQSVGGIITFDPTVFAAGNSTAANTITVSSATLNLPSNTTISGPTSGTGGTLKNLVTISGGGTLEVPVISVTSSAINDAISNLTITGANDQTGSGGAINNGYQATLTLNSCTIAGNLSTGTAGIFNDYNAILTVNDSTISGNTGGIGGLVNEGGGVVYLINSTVSGNTGSNETGGILNAGNQLYITGSTITGNTGQSSGGISADAGSAVTLSNTIVSGNTPQDISGSVTDNGGNVLSVSASDLGLAALGAYGGPTKTMPALPSSPAFCAGTLDNAMAQTIDQRGFARTTVYSNGGTPVTCVDSGAVETDYALSFTTNPPASVVETLPISPAPVVTLTESGYAVTYSGGSVSIADAQTQLAASSTLTAAFASGAAGFSNLVFTTTPTNDSLNASSTVSGSGAPTPVELTATSTQFSVASGGTVTVAANAAATYSANAQNVMLTATVMSGGTNINAGTVTFTVLNGGTTVGTAATGPVSNGVASVSYTLPAGTAANTYTILATFNASGPYLTSSDSTHMLTVAKATATVMLGSLSQTYSGSPEPATATTTPAGLTVTFTYTGTNGTTYATTATAPTSAGSYAVAGTISSSNYSGSAGGTLVISKATATVMLGSLAQVYSGSPEAATAVTTPVGLAVTFTYTGTSGTTYATSATPPTGVGSYTVAGTISDSNYSGSATGTLVISKATATVMLGSLAQIYSGSPEAATAVTTPVGLAVTFTYTGTNGTSYATSATPPTNTGSYTVVGTISDSNYSGSGTGTLVISKASATVMLGSLAQTYSGSPEAATAVTTPAGLSVTFTYTGINGTSYATSSSAPTNVGSYTVAGTISSANYSGSATGTLVISKATGTVILGDLAQTYSGSAEAATAVTTPSGLTVTFAYTGTNGTTYATSSSAPTNAGSYTVVATISNPNYSGTATGTLVISQATATVMLGSLAQTYSGSPEAATAVTTPAGLAVTFTYTGTNGTSYATSAAAPTNAGSYTVVGAIGNANYTGSATGTLVIGKATATITLGSLAQTYSGSPEAATAVTTPAGLTVTLTYTGTNGTTYATSASAPTGAGSYAIAATLNSANYSGTATGTLVISKAAATVMLGDLTQTYSGSPEAATSTTTPAGLTVNLTYTGTGGTTYATSTTAPTSAGSYTVAATINDSNYSGTATGTLTISKAAAAVKLAGLAQTYSGSPEAATATTTPAGLTVTFTYTGAGTTTYPTSATAPTGAGSYVVVATINNANYAGTATGTLVIGVASSSVTLTSSANPVLQDNAITFTATVTSPAGTPTGTVSFYDGTTLLGPGTLSGGVATYITSSLATGAHTIKAEYSGDSNFAASHSLTLGELVQDFNFKLGTPLETILPGSTASLSFVVSPTEASTFPAEILFTASGLPAGYSGTFSPNPIPSGASTTTVIFTLSPTTAANNVLPGRVGAELAGRHARRIAGELAPFALALLLLPFTRRLRRTGKRLGRMLSVLLLLGAGLAAMTGLSGCGSNNGFFGQAPRTYTVTITGTSGGLSHSGTLTVTVE